MSSHDRLFDLLWSQVAELGIAIKHAGRTASISADGSLLFDLTHGIDVDNPRDVSKYFVRLCCTGFSGEAQVTTLKERRSGKSIGYIFPLTSLRTGEYIEGVWPRAFAEVGFRAVTNLDTLARFSSFGAIGEYRDKSLYLDDVISDEVSILVVGLDALQGAGISTSVLQFLMLREGVTLIDTPGEIGKTFCADDWRPSITVSAPGDVVSSETEVFVQLFRSADLDATGVGAFMLMYQALEFCIDHIFSWGMQELSQGGLSTWEMKAKLSDITGERYRLGVLDSKCISAIRSRSSLMVLSESARLFLNEINADSIDDDVSWVSSLYKARNIIVHNQIRMMKAPQAPLADLNKSLRAASFDLLLSFSKPAEPFVNPAASSPAHVLAADKTEEASLLADPSAEKGARAHPFIKLVSGLFALLIPKAS